MRPACTLPLAVLALFALPVRAGETSASFTVGARVVRSGSVAVGATAAGAEPGISLRAGRGAARAGYALASESAWRTASVPAAALSKGATLPHAAPGERVIVTVLLDGHPTAVRFVGGPGVGARSRDRFSSDR